jgi:hypothetical protein
MDQSHCLGPIESFHQHSHRRRLKPSLVLISSLQELLPLVWQELWVRPWSNVGKAVNFK